MTRILHSSTWPTWLRKTVVMAAASILFVSPTATAIGYTVLASRVSETAKTGYLESCDGTNEVRTQVRDLTDSLLVRSKKSAAATLASPTATPRQKLVARQNLDAGETITEQIHLALQLKRCAYPPVTTTTLAR